MTQQEIDAAYQRGFARAVKEAGILSNLYKSVKQMGPGNTARAMVGRPTQRTLPELHHYYPQGSLGPFRTTGGSPAITGNPIIDTTTLPARGLTALLGALGLRQAQDNVFSTKYDELNKGGGASESPGILSNLYKSVGQMGVANTARAMVGRPTVGAKPTAPKKLGLLAQRNKDLAEIMSGQ